MQVVIMSNQIIVIVITKVEEHDLCQDFNVFKIQFYSITKLSLSL